uniref:uncharacterized protein LOC124073179 isoform X2 n=1 Tax=Scatophagus argus TaxID=75038 RepID=UPI001ED842C2|nr:uncharacterized protein LOC124073179 isoform X2 [Scatophagus argus]
MHLKQKGYCFGVLLIYTITTITLPPVGWCESTVYASQTNSHLILHDDRKRDLTSGGLTHPPSRGGGGRLHLDSRSLPYIDNLDNGEETQTKTSGRPERTNKLRMASTTSSNRSFKNQEKVKQTEGEWESTSTNPPDEVCNEGKIKPVVHGKFYITGQLKASVPSAGYQSDSAVSGPGRIRGQWLRHSKEIWQRLQPVVECGDDAMTLTVRRKRAVQLRLDRMNESSVPFSQLPPQCGYSVQTTWTDLSLTSQYDACHVTLEDDSYVLPLLWRGTPVKMSCPTSQIWSQAVGLLSPPSVCCSQYGMTVKVQGLSAAEALRVNVRGEWTPLMLFAEQCGYTLDRRDTEIVIAAPFIACGITVKDGKYTLSLQVGETTFTLACPVSYPKELPLTYQSLVNGPPTRGPAEHTSASLETFPWTPPFYLAPPYYPHPTYHYKYPSPDGYDEYNPHPPSPSTPDTKYGLQAYPSVNSHLDSQGYYGQQIPVKESDLNFGVHSSQSSLSDMGDSSLLYPDLQQNQETPVLGLSEKRSAAHSPSSNAGFPLHIESLPLQPHSPTLNQYYHYYHQPKVPLPDLPQDLDPDPKSHNPESPVSEALNRFNLDQFFQHEAASHPYTLPTSAPYTPYPPQPYPYRYLSYFPYLARGQAKRLAPLNPDVASKTNLLDHQNTKSSSFVDPLPHTSEDDEEYKFHLYIDQPNPDEMIHFKENSPDWTKHPLLSDSDGVKEVQLPLQHADADSPPERPFFPKNNLPSYPYDEYYPYSHYYQLYYGPESLLSHVSPTSSKEALDPLLKASSSPPQQHLYHKPQTTAPPTKSMYDIHLDPLHPYYYYHLFYHPEVSVDNEQVHPTTSMNSKSESLLPSDSATEAGYPNMPQSSPLHGLYHHDITPQHPYDSFGHPDGDEGEERLDNDVKVGQHLIFAVPDSVLESAVPPLAHSPEVINVSCTLQRLTSDPDIYIVLLDDCEVNKHMFGRQTVVHLLEVCDIDSLQRDYSSVHEDSPVRLMVECSSSPASQHEVRLHMINQPRPHPVLSTSAVVTVQLRIATDESFTTFHPEAHLPLGLIRGRPVYVEVRLLDPPEPGLVLLVHSCLAYSPAPYASWMLVYDGCPSQGFSQLLHSPRSDHIRRIIIYSFLSHSESPIYVANRGYSHLEDPEIFFLCLTEACSTADGDCTVGCVNSPNSDGRAKNK